MVEIEEKLKRITTWQQNLMMLTAEAKVQEWTRAMKDRDWIPTLEDPRGQERYLND
jgi:hypothetical protein